MSDDKGVGLKGWIAGQKSKSAPEQKKTEAISLEKNRVAVLPFVNMISDPADEYFSDGMTEELISTLANVSGLQVISRTSIMQYKNTNKKAVEIGKDLTVGSIIEGSVRKAGNQLRITVQLVDTQQDKHLWAQTYDRELKDVFSVQSDIARNVSEALRVKLLPRESAQLQKNATNSMEAYTLYLRGRFHWNKRTREGVEKAIEYFHLAIDQDPNYALAYVGLADCYGVSATFGYMPDKEGYSIAKEAVSKALELDNNLAEAHASLAWTLMADWSWAAAEAEFKRAIELNPNYAIARTWYSTLLANLDRPEEALVEVQRAYERDPLSPRIASDFGHRLYSKKEYDLSIEQYKRALEIQPDFSDARFGLATAYAKHSMCEEALAECQTIDSMHHSDLEGKLVVAYVYALCGRKDEAGRLLKDNAWNLKNESSFPVLAAAGYSALGKKDEAIQLLQRGYEAHNSNLMMINALKEFDDLVSDRRFIELQKKIGLNK